MRLSDWSSDVCSSDLRVPRQRVAPSAVLSPSGILLSSSLISFNLLPLAVSYAAEPGLIPRARRLPPVLPESAHAASPAPCGAWSAPSAGDRKRVVKGRGVSVRVALGGRSILKTNTRTSETRNGRE